MARTSGCSRLVKELGLLDTSCAMGAPASENDHATMSSSVLSAQVESMLEAEKSEDVSVHEQIEHSKAHWSMLTDFSADEAKPLQPWRKHWPKFMLCCSDVGDEEVAEVSNVEEFLALQRHPIWGSFFGTFYGEDGDEFDLGELKVGELFAAGAQAELYDAKVKWRYPKRNDEDLKMRREYALKIFRKGTLLKLLKYQLPQGLLQIHFEAKKNWESPTPIKIPRFHSQVHRATLLKDGRFAFLMEKERCDLRRLIDDNMKLNSGKDCGPFSNDEAEVLMYRIAMGVDWLHNRDIVHRDLKASNVLVGDCKSNSLKNICRIADYECSVGVAGTTFFRAPEILQACKDQKLYEREEVFSKAADIYGYGMICYEVLTGKLPFEDRPKSDYDHVLSGKRPLVPKHVKDWIHELLCKCWHSDPAARPCIGDILNMILAHSIEARELKAFYKENYGKEKRDLNIMLQ